MTTSLDIFKRGFVNKNITQNKDNDGRVMDINKLMERHYKCNSLQEQ
jgi:hypothetical protein